ncbi:MAG TPA: MFS transporter, partial [Planctomycetota bacterium]|nr:MFS transporter [Planctomycetota bacterium]
MARISARYPAVALGQDLSLFAVWAILPLWAKLDANATPLQLGALPVFGGLPYVVTALFAGRFSDRVSRTTLARIGLALFALFCLLASRVATVGQLFLASPLAGLSNGLIWPALQAKMGDESGPHDLDRNLGLFSVSWCMGKAIGFFVSGVVQERYGLSALPWFGLLSLALVPVVPGRTPPPSSPRAPLVPHDAPLPRVRQAYLHAAWLANFASYGLGSTLSFLYPDLVKKKGWGGTEYALVTGTLFFSQAAAFYVFGRFSGWRYRWKAFVSWQAASALALLAVGLGAPVAAAVPLAVLGGAGLGLAYAASIYYSVHTDVGRGARAGLHEAFTGASNFAIPLLGGALQSWTGWGTAPYAWSAALVAVSGALQVRL